MSAPRISVITCSIDAGKFARVSECYKHLLAGFPHEIIGIHDATSLAEGYSRGLAQSSGDILIFTHDDILILDPAFAEKIVARTQDYDLLGFAGTDKLITATWFGAGPAHQHGVVGHAKPGRDHLTLSIYGAAEWPVVGGIEAIDGFCMIASRRLCEQIRFDAATFDGFHLYDLDFSYAAHLAGFRLGVCCDIPILHESAGNFANQHLHYAERFVLKYADRFAATRPQDITGERPGRGARFADHHALLHAWQRDILLRATQAMRRPQA
jgi:hypothetical protein